jgi:hypothetical protein
MTDVTKQNNDILIYKSNDGQVSFDVNVMDETVWLTQAQIAELFDKHRVTITDHINNVFSEGELDKNSVCRDFLHTASDGKKYKTQYYNLDVIISVGYRVKSQRGTQFRQWSNKVLKSYMLNGYAINEHRIAAIENKLESLTTEIRTEVKTELQNIYKVLAQIAGNPQPIIINNQIQLGSDKLEDKIIEALDEMINSSKDTPLNKQLQEIKQDIKNSSDNSKSKNKVTRFFKAIGDAESDTGKAIKGAGIAGKLITKLIQLGEKFL